MRLQKLLYRAGGWKVDMTSTGMLLVKEVFARRRNPAVPRLSGRFGLDTQQVLFYVLAERSNRVGRTSDNALAHDPGGARRAVGCSRVAHFFTYGGSRKIATR